MILLILLYITFLGIYSSLGAVEALLWARKGAESFKWNEHAWVLAPQRVWIGITILLTGLCANLYGAIIVAVFVASIPAFFFFHQGTMYMVRNHINHLVYPNRWKDDSTTSTAKINVEWGWRLGLFIMSVLSLASTFIIWLRNFS